jgi:hypothetical protein
VQDLGAPIEQLLAFGFIAVALALSWLLDKKYEAGTSLQFIFPEDGDIYLAALEAGRKGAKAYVGMWWVGAIIQVSLMSVGGYLIFSLYGGISFLILFGFFKLTSGIFFLKPNIDTLSVFERTLEAKAAIMPLTEMFLKQEMDRCITEGLLRQEDYHRLLLHLSVRSDVIGSIAKQLAEQSSL